MAEAEYSADGSQRAIRIDEVGSNGCARMPGAHRDLPKLLNDAGCGPVPAENDPKSSRLAQLSGFRERGIISEQAFRAQRRMQGGSHAGSPGPAKPATPPPGRQAGRRWQLVLGCIALLIVALAVVWSQALKPLYRGPRPAAFAGATVPKSKAGSPAVYSLGKAFRLGPYTYTVTGCETAVALGSEFNPMRPNPGNEYVIVTFSVRNDSTKPRVVSTDPLKLADADGAVYTACGQGAAAPRTELTRHDIWLTEVRPGSTKTLAAAFEVPVTALKPPIKLFVFDQGLLGSGEAIVDLQF